MERHIIYFFILFSLYSYTPTTQQDKAFEKDIYRLEDNPEAFLPTMGVQPISTITNGKDATTYLLQSLAAFYTNQEHIPSKKILKDCISIFEKENLISQQLKAMYLLILVYQKEKDLTNELAILNKSITLAQQKEDNESLFHLYNHMSGMYLREYDLNKFIKYQTLALQFINGIDSPNVHTQIEMAQNMLFLGKYKEAKHLLDSIESSIKKESFGFGDYKRLQGIASFKLGMWHDCIVHMKAAIEKEHRVEKLFSCYSILTYCYYCLGDLVLAQTYKNLTISTITKDINEWETTEFYKICAELDGDNHIISEQITYLKKTVNGYNYIFNKLSQQNLSQAVQSYNNLMNQTKHEQQINKYKLYILSLVIISLLGIIVYLYKTRKQAYKLFCLQKQISILENMKEMHENNKLFILNDFEIAKKIAVLKQTQKEKSDKILKELDRFKMFKENSILCTQWDKFYHYIDLYFERFYTKLVKTYPELNEKEIQLCCMMMAEFKTNEIAAIWEQSVFSVHKYKTKIRKKRVSRYYPWQEVL